MDRETGFAALAMLGVQWVIAGMPKWEIIASVIIARARDKKEKGLIRLISLSIFWCM